MGPAWRRQMMGASEFFFQTCSYPSPSASSRAKIDAEIWREVRLAWSAPKGFAQSKAGIVENLRGAQSESPRETNSLSG